METHHARRNVALYKLFVLFNEALFWGPILIISLQKLGHMSLPDIYFMESVVMILCVLLNIPTGALADVIGRFFLLASTVGFATLRSPFEAWLANILWAIGFSFQSGADQALLYNTLKDARLEKSFTKIEGCAVGSRLLVAAFCSLAVGPLAEINMRLPLFMSIPYMIIPLVTSFFLKEQRVTSSYNPKQQIAVLKKGILFAVRKPEVRWIIGLCALLLGASKIWFFTYNPYFEKVGMPLRYYGVVFFFLNVVAWLCSHYAYKIESFLSEKYCVLLMILCVGLPILLMGIFPFWPMAFLVVVQNVVRGFMRPFVGNFMNRHIDSEEIRATALSVRGTLTDIVSILSLSLFGFMDKSLGLLISLVVLGVVVLILGKVSFGRYKRLFPETLVKI